MLHSRLAQESRPKYRHDFESTSTNKCAILCPRQAWFWARARAAEWPKIATQAGTGSRCARNEHSGFIVRVEDTDLARLTKGTYIVHYCKVKMKWIHSLSKRNDRTWWNEVTLLIFAASCNFICLFFINAFLFYDFLNKSMKTIRIGEWSIERPSMARFAMGRRTFR